MCEDCAYNRSGKKDSEECKICSLNPSNVNVAFEPKTYRGFRIEKPIVMYISKEHMTLLEKLFQQRLVHSIRSTVYPAWPFYTDWNAVTFSGTSSMYLTSINRSKEVKD